MAEGDVKKVLGEFPEDTTGSSSSVVPVKTSNVIITDSNTSVKGVHGTYVDSPMTQSTDVEKVVGNSEQTITEGSRTIRQILDAANQESRLDAIVPRESLSSTISGDTSDSGMVGIHNSEEYKLRGKTTPKSEVNYVKSPAVQPKNPVYDDAVGIKDPENYEDSANLAVNKSVKQVVDKDSIPTDTPSSQDHVPIIESSEYSSRDATLIGDTGGGSIVGDVNEYKATHDRNFITNVADKVIDAAIDTGLSALNGIGGGLGSGIISQVNSGALSGLFNDIFGTNVVRVKDSANSIAPSFDNAIDIATELFEKLAGPLQTAVSIKSSQTLEYLNPPGQVVNSNSGVMGVVGKVVGAVSGETLDSTINGFKSSASSILSDLISGDKKKDTTNGQKVRDAFRDRIEDIRGEGNPPKVKDINAEFPMSGRADIDTFTKELGGPGSTVNFAVCIYPLDSVGDIIRSDKSELELALEEEGVPFPPYYKVFPTGWVPCVAYDLSTDQIFTENIAFSDLFSFEVPSGLGKVHRISTTILESKDHLVFNYLQKYKKYLISDDKLNERIKIVKPINKSISLVRIITYNKQFDRLNEWRFYSIPRIELTRQSNSTNDIQYITIDWNVVGQSTYIYEDKYIDENKAMNALNSSIDLSQLSSSLQNFSGVSSLGSMIA